MSKIKKIAALLGLVVLSVTAFAGCGKKGNPAHAKIDKNTVYREEELSISFPADYNVNNAYFSGNTAYFVGYSYDKVTYDYTSSIVVADLTTGATKVSPLDNQIWINALLPFDDGSFALLYEKSTYDETDPENPIYDYAYVMELRGADGKIQKEVNLTKDYEMGYASGVVSVPGGIVLTSYDRLLFLDEKLNKIKDRASESDMGFDIGGVYKMRDGSLVVSKWGESGQEYNRFNPQTLEIGDKIDTILSKAYNYSVMQGRGYDFFLRDNTQIYGYNLGDAEPTPLLNFINSDIYTSYFSAFDSIDDRTFIGFYQSWEDDEYSLHVCKYSKVDPENVVDKEIISLGCQYLDDNIRRMVVDFNRKNEKYRINVVDYSIYATEDDYMAGTNRFNNDIAIGQGPDIIVTDGASKSDNFISKGLYLDLTKYFDKDEEISKDILLPGILEASSKKGKIYQVVPSFTIRSAGGKKSVLGDRTGWTVSELLEFEKTLPSGMTLFFDMTRESFLYYLFAVNGSEYVNPTTGRCSFDSDEFKAVLEILKSLKNSEDFYNELYGKGDDFNWSEYQYNVRNNKAAVTPINIFAMYSYKELLRGTIGEEIAFVGFPGEDRKGSCYCPSFSLGISSRCSHPDGAWELIRQFLLEDYQTKKVYNLPSTVKAFDAMLEEAKQRPHYTDENGEEIYYDDTIWIGNQDIPSEPLTDAEAETFKEFVNSIGKFEQSMDDISNIIFEEAAPYFEGQKTVDEVVKIIQSRVSIFVNEQQ